MIASEQDTMMRMAAFNRVMDLQAAYGHLTANEFKPGFDFEGERIPLINPQRGIFKPKRMEFPLSIRTVFPRPGKKIWYDDQRYVHRQIFESVDTVDYAFMGTDPDAADNRWLRDAFENRVPIIYFVGIAPGIYRALLPVFISGWNADTLKASVAFAQPLQQGPFAESAIHAYPESSSVRRYAIQLVKRRLHQSMFRNAIIHAYKGRCAVSGLPEPLLLDAAHIVPDSEEKLGEPIVPNGLPLSKIHHAAFDKNLIGIDPDYCLHVSGRLLDKNDGPFLESLKRLDGGTIHLPNRDKDRPDRDRLAIRFERFRAAA